MKRLLFVDDEPLVLGAFQRMLWPLRADFVTEFAESGEAALTALGREPFDVIVSDLRMPGIDGAALLSIVRDRWPSVVRITLSGESSSGSWMKVIPLAHRFLAKPCPADLLRNTVVRACELRSLLENDELRAIATGLRGIPSLPRLYLDIVRELEKPEPSMTMVASIVSKDVGMTVRLMQVANSPIFGRHWPAANVNQAVIVLGANLTRNLVLTVGLFTGFTPDAEIRFGLRQLWNHCRRTAEMARTIVEDWNAEPRMAQEAATSGFLHEVGKLVYAASVPDRYAAVRRRAGKSEKDLLAAELEEFGATHATIGAYVLGLWELPQTVIEAVAWHHFDGKTDFVEPSALAAVQIADELIDAIDEDREPELEPFAKLGTPDQFTNWRQLSKTFDTAGV